MTAYRRILLIMTNVAGKNCRRNLKKNILIQGVPGEYATLRENVPYVKVHRSNQKTPISEVERLRR